MNDILSITVEANLKQGMSEKNIHQLALKMRRNEKTIERSIINLYIFLKCPEMHGV